MHQFYSFQLYPELTNQGRGKSKHSSKIVKESWKKWIQRLIIWERLGSYESGTRGRLRLWADEIMISSAGIWSGAESVIQPISLDMKSGVWIFLYFEVELIKLIFQVKREHSYKRHGPWPRVAVQSWLSPVESLPTKERDWWYQKRLCERGHQNNPQSRWHGHEHWQMHMQINKLWPNTEIHTRWEETNWQFCVTYEYQIQIEYQ